MIKYIAAIFAVLVGGFFVPAYAQSNSPVLLPSGCGTGNMTNGPSYLTEDASGRLCDSSSGYAYSNITGDVTTTVKASPGALHTITFNNPVATETVTIYDNTAASGTKIGTVTVPASPMPVTLTYDVNFGTGLTIVTAIATSDITVSYK